MPTVLDHQQPYQPSPEVLDELIAAAEGSLLAAHRGEAIAQRSETSATALIDAVTGAVLAIIKDEPSSSLDTTVETALAAKYLAPTDTRVVAIVAAGEVALLQAHAMARVLPHLEEIRVCSSQPITAVGCATCITADLGLPAEAASTVAGAVADADVAIAIGNWPRTLPGPWIRPGALVVYQPPALPADLLATSRRFVGSLRAPRVIALRVRPGDVLTRPRYDQARDRELAEVILGSCVAREADDQTVVYELLPGTSPPLPRSAMEAQ